ncbi:MAG: amidohydrolase family protein [Candidatus Sericytochromatia bacterium]|nr:amidohydrolase family protein [Candidatus Sericytochromatia bacterium]
MPTDEEPLPEPIQGLGSTSACPTGDPAQAQSAPLVSPEGLARLGGPFIDAHAHLFPDRLMAAIWRAFRADGYALQHEGTSATVADALLRTGAERLFLLVYAHKAGMAASLNDWLYTVTRDEPRFVPFGTVHPDDADRAAIVSRCLIDQGFAGLKLHCSVQRMPCDDPRLDPVYEIVQDAGRAVIIHAGTAPYRDAHTGVVHARRLVARFPDLKVVFAHLGMWEVEAFGALAAANANVYLDCSSVIAYPRFTAQMDLDWLGGFFEQLADKILWGSDYPYLESDYEAPLLGLWEMGLSAAAVAKIRHDNAQRLLAVIRPEVVRSV